MNNREIKFRIWCKSRNRFTRYVNNSIGDDVYFSINVLGGLEAIDRFGDEVDINQTDFVIQQFTGLVDKNGKEIYEGDILKSIEDLDSDCCHGDVTTYIKYSEVKFKNGYFTSDEEKPFFLCMNPNWFEVVGNIFENPELLKQ